ncbi:MAG: hypothetical protein WBF42_14925 [Terracidiphilus sp.]
MKEESQLPALTPSQIEVLRRYALFEAGIGEVREALSGIYELDLRHDSRAASGSFRVPEPGIVITREHIANALERRRFDLVSERDLAEWASILLSNDAYILDPGDEDLIADWLNDISALLGAR